MTIKKCDRCYKEFTAVSLHGLTLKRKRFPLSDEEIDICPLCAKELKDWFYSKGEFAESEDKENETR